MERFCRTNGCSDVISRASEIDIEKIGSGLWKETWRRSDLFLMGNFWRNLTWYVKFGEKFAVCVLHGGSDAW